MLAILVYSLLGRTCCLFCVIVVTRDVFQASGSCPEVYDCWKMCGMEGHCQVRRDMKDWKNRATERGNGYSASERPATPQTETVTRNNKDRRYQCTTFVQN